MKIKRLLLLFLCLLLLTGTGCRKDSPIPSSASSATALPTGDTDPSEPQSGPQSEPQSERQTAPQNESQSTQENTPSSVPQDETQTEASGTEAEDTQTAENHNTVPAEDGTGQQAETAEEHLCSLTIDCSAILSHLDQFDQNKLSLLPADGIIYTGENLSFSEGETVFDLLKRVTAENKIHMEFSTSPGYQSAYVEGINNIYEFDCGELSGWTYRVNGENPGYGCSDYTLKNGDAVEWLYTCDLGRDA